MKYPRGRAISRGCTFWMALLTALIPAAVFCSSAKQPTTSNFPTNRTIGKIYAVDAQEPLAVSPIFLGPARGAVRIPAGRMIMLRIEDVSAANLAALSECPPEKIGIVQFTNTDFGDAHIKYLAPLKHLWGIYLDGTEITDKGLAELAQFAELEFVNVRETEVSGAGLAPLKHLKQFDGMLSDVTDAGLESLRGKDLASVRFSRTHIGDKTIGIISGAKNLTNLQLNSTRITEGCIGHICGFSKLQRLDLQANKLSGKAVARLGRLPIQELVLEECGVGDEVFEDAAAFGSLTRVRFGYNNFSDRALKSLASKKSLITLDVTDDPVGDAGVAAISTLPQLNSLTLVGTGITDRSLKALDHASVLRNLAVSNTKVSKAGVAEFRHHHPRCLVTSDFMFD
jgi:internalin A